MKTIFFITGDRGCTRDLLSVADVLARRGFVIRWFADPHGNGCELLMHRGVPFATRSPDVSDSPAALIVGTSVTAPGLQLTWTAWGKARKIPVIWHEDMPSTAANKNTRNAHPDLLSVVDASAAAVVRATRPAVRSLIVGKPGADELRAVIIAREEHRRALHADYALPVDAFLATYLLSHDDPARVATHLDALVAAIRPLPTAVLGVRFHPKFPETDRETLRNRLKTQTARWVELSVGSGEAVAVGSDAVVTEMASSLSIVASLARVPVIIMLFPPDPLRPVTDFPDGLPPLVASGVAQAARSTVDLAIVLAQFAAAVPMKSSISSDLAFFLRPGAEERIADAVLAML